MTPPNTPSKAAVETTLPARELAERIIDLNSNSWQEDFEIASHLIQELLDQRIAEAIQAQQTLLTQERDEARAVVRECTEALHKVMEFAEKWCDAEHKSHPCWDDIEFARGVLAKHADEAKRGGG